MEEKVFVCVNCPMGCHVKVELENGEIREVSGNRCPRGKQYAMQECIQPMRILTSTVRVEGGMHRVLPVITSSEIPLEKMEEAMQEIRTISVKAPIRVKDVIVDDLCGTGVSLIASRSMERVA